MLGEARVQHLLILKCDYQAIIHNMEKYFKWKPARTNEYLKTLNAFEDMPEIYGKQKRLKEFGGKK